MKKITIFFALLLPVFSLNATNYFVSNSGSDSNTGLDADNAFETLQHAADQVTAGDTVLVASGAYVGFDLREAFGTENAPIVFKTLGEEVLINQSGPVRDDGVNIENCAYIVIDGFTVNDMTGNGNGIRVVVSDHCVVRNCRCDNNAERGIFTAFTDDILIEYNVCSNSVDEHGIYVSNSSDRPVVRYNECYGNNNIGIHFNGDLSEGGDGIISDAEVYGNIIYENNLAAGINMDGVENPVIYNNVIYNNHFGQGIALFQQDGAIPTRGAKVYNNTIIVPEDGRWGILVKNGSNINTEIYNNIIINLHQWRGSIALENTQQFKSNYNILSDKMGLTGDGSSAPLVDWQILGLDINSAVANPLGQIFVGHENGDFHLRMAAQPVDAGSDTVKTIVMTDIEGTPRPYGTDYDIGAYEWQLVTDVEELGREKMSLYPNPASDFIKIDFGWEDQKIRQLRLIDLQGRVVRQFGVRDRRLDLEGIEAGVYLLEIFVAAAKRREPNPYHLIPAQIRRISRKIVIK